MPSRNTKARSINFCPEPRLLDSALNRLIYHVPNVQVQRFDERAACSGARAHTGPGFLRAVGVVCRMDGLDLVGDRNVR